MGSSFKSHSALYCRGRMRRQEGTNEPGFGTHIHSLNLITLPSDTCGLPALCWDLREQGRPLATTELALTQAWGVRVRREKGVLGHNFSSVGAFGAKPLALLTLVPWICSRCQLGQCLGWKSRSREISSGQEKDLRRKMNHLYFPLAFQVQGPTWPLPLTELRSPLRLNWVGPQKYNGTFAEDGT